MISVRKIEKDEFELGYEIRKQVFIIEQEIPAELEYDNYDEISSHFIAEENGKAVGYCRVYEKDGFGKIGRVAVLKSHRGKGIAKALITFVENALPFSKWVVHSQTYIVPLYSKCGYSTVGDEFIEDGIMHYKMIKEIE